MEYKHAIKRNFVETADKKYEPVDLEYTLYYQDGKLIDVRNSFNSSVQQGSQIWDHFNKTRN
jgi:hypothetical protein